MAKPTPNPMVEHAIEYAAQCSAEDTPEFKAMKEALANTIRSASMGGNPEKVPTRESSWQMNMSSPTRGVKKGK